MAGSLGTLNVLLSADTAQFSSAMDKAAFKAEQNLKRIGFQANAAKFALAGIATAAVTGFASMILKFSETADHLYKLSQSTGVSVENLSRLQYAAKLTGVEFDAMSKPLALLNKHIAEGDPIFTKLGIAIRDSKGHLRSAFDVLLDTAALFEKYKDGAGKAAAAQALFGKTGADLIPLLNSGRDGLRRYSQEADSFNQTISTKTAQAAERFNDNVTKMQARVEGFFKSIAGPALEGANTLIDTIEKVHNAMKAPTVNQMQGLDMLDAMDKRRDGIKDSVQDLGKIVISSDKAVKATKDWDIALNGVKNQTERINKMADDIGAAFVSNFEDAIIEAKKFSDVLNSLLKDIERALLKNLILQPLGDSISAGIKGFFAPKAAGAAPAVASRHGNVFQAFASGGVINGPMTFPMTGGKRGLAGEAGKEAILPLTRTASGDLGVRSAGAGKVEVNVYAPPGSTVTKEEQDTGGMQRINVYIDEAVAKNINKPGTKTHNSLKGTFGLGQTLTKR